MDREIPKSERRRARLRKAAVVAAVVIAVVTATAVVSHLLGGSVSARSLEFSTVSTGDLQVSVTASGSIVPEYEQIIVSPISTRIVEVYKKAGDHVSEGEALLRLDLQSAETDYHKGLDDEKMRVLQLQKLRINQNTRLTDLKMQVSVARMTLNSKRMELRNERYLDSIGSGTTDRVRQAELDYHTAELSVQQLETQLANETRAAQAEYRVQQLNLEMYRKTLAEMRRVLDDAKIRSPRRAVLTSICTSIGAQISQGQQVAVVSDLSSFKADCTIADGYADRLAVGGRVIVRSGKKTLTGTISSLNPQARNAMLDFTVRLDDPGNALLRSGLKVEVSVLTAEKAGVRRIKSGPYYQGPGTYRLFVRNGNRLEARDVRLGEASYDYVEVTGGLSDGEQVVVSDMEQYKSRRSLTLKQ